MEEKNKEFTLAQEHAAPPPECAALPPEVLPPDTVLPGEASAAESAAALKKKTAKWKKIAIMLVGLSAMTAVAVTGGIHLDGYADTSDALSSYGDREKKLEILKDSHCGAFAVIRLCCYFVAYFGLCGSVRFTPRAGLCWTLALVLERALSGFAVAAFPLAKDTGLAHTFATAADKQTVRRFLCGLSALLILALTALGGGGLAAAALLALWRYYFVAKKQFGGITGDLAGWFLQRAELWMLAALCACQWGGLI